MTARRVEPSRSLLQGAPYTKAADTCLRTKWAEFFDSARKPDNADDYQASAIAERRSFQDRRAR